MPVVSARARPDLLCRPVGFVEIPPYDDYSMDAYQDSLARAAYQRSEVFMER